MLVHVVLLKFAPRMGEERLEELVRSLRALPGVIPEIVSYTVSRDAGLAADNAEISVIAHFADEAGWRTYSDHPAHRRVIEEQILPYLERRSATQYFSSDESDI